MPHAHAPSRRLGSSRVAVSPLGLGTTGLASMYRTVSADGARETLDAAWDAGIRYFDTAPAYGSGRAELRLGEWLAGRPRGEFVVSTKVGYRLDPLGADEEPAGIFADALPAKTVHDYSRDAILRSLEQSLERLGADRVDMVAIHDPDEAAAIEPGADPYARSHFAEAMDGAYPALAELRSQGVVGAIGVGMTGSDMLVDFARAGDFDYFLLAGRYTLLEQHAAEILFPLCLERDIAIVLGGPYSSGILATGAVPGATYDYAPAPPHILGRVKRIEAVCGRHDVALRSAALQFAAAHPAVTTIIPGARSAEEVRENVAFLAAPIPDAFWADLREQGLIA